jgi:hypothetical protein
MPGICRQTLLGVMAAREGTNKCCRYLLNDIAIYSLRISDKEFQAVKYMLC